MDVAHVAKLAALPLTLSQQSTLQSSLTDTLKLVDHLQKLDTINIEPTSQVTGLANVTRPDVIDTSRMLTQDQALSQAAATHNGFFKIPAIFK